jgi:hypothetical protein
MGNYGFRISISGQDVKTCGDLDTLVNSKYALLKGYISGSGSVNVPVNDSATVNIAHALGYITFAEVYFTYDGDTMRAPNDYVETPGGSLAVYANSELNNLRISFVQTFGSGQITVDYRYFMFYDNGNLW